MALNIFTTRTLYGTLPYFSRGARRSANPGIGHQLKILDTPNSEESDFANLESDFMTVHKSHKQHELEMAKQRESKRLLLVKQKYFKKKLPNFLTFAEKEQMRLLHSRDPEEWSIEKLSESFPATPDVVAKIIDSNWRPHTAERVRKHDESVIRNWELLRSEGFSSLPSELKKHLEKFSDRTHDDLLQKGRSEQEWQSRSNLAKPKSKEFSSIITSCRKYAEKSDDSVLSEGKNYNAASSKANYNDAEDTYLLANIQDKRRMRLQELKQVKLSVGDPSPACGKTGDLLMNQLAATRLTDPCGTGILSRQSDRSEASDGFLNGSDVEKFQSNEIVFDAETRQRYELTSSKDRIYIPRKLWKKGATYKIEDSYYDDDGEFLYRVPGMIAKRDN